MISMTTVTPERSTLDYARVMFLEAQKYVVKKEAREYRRFSKESQDCGWLDLGGEG